MKNTFLAFLALSALAVSCKKSSSDSGTAPQKYMNLAAGSTWTYESVNNLTVTTTTNIVTSTNRDSSINGRSYHVFTNSNGAANDYYNITGSDYYTFRTLPGASGVPPLDIIYLKENAAVGTSWSQTVNLPLTGFPSGVPVVFTNTITETGISRTVNARSYTGVVHIVTGISVTGLPASSITSDIQSYYAPDYGLIESKTKISTTLLPSSNVDQNTTLKTATLK
ncbi:hypothetical protein [Ferruginibacter sp.]